MKKLLPLFLVILLMFSACSKKPEKETNLPEISPAPTISPEESPTPTPAPSPQPTPEPIYHPLTGEIIEEEFPNSRPFAFMINNYKNALPHCGVSQADIIYEVLAEGEITRMLAIFSDISDVEKLGSMRSSRPYYINISESYDAIYVHAGGSEQAYIDIANNDVDNIDGVNGNVSPNTFYRDPNRMQYGTEHSLFTSGEAILEALIQFGYRDEHESDFGYGLNFADTPEMENAEIAQNVVVSFQGLKTTDFSYDNEKNTYAASQFNAPYIDGNNNETLEFSNLLVLFSKHVVLDNAGRRRVDIDTSGEGYFIYGGEKIDITWSHEYGEPFRYFTKDGNELELGRGKTYVGIVPLESEISMS